MAAAAALWIWSANRPRASPPTAGAAPAPRVRIYAGRRCPLDICPPPPILSANEPVARVALARRFPLTQPLPPSPMLEIKVQCDCGQKFKFDVEPAGGRMPFGVNCPVCGADGTSKANEILRRVLPPPVPAGASQPPGPPAPAAAAPPRARITMPNRPAAGSPPAQAQPAEPN